MSPAADECRQLVPGELRSNIGKHCPTMRARMRSSVSPRTSVLHSSAYGDRAAVLPEPGRWDEPASRQCLGSEINRTRPT